MENKIFQIQIALKGFKPKIWRRIQILADLLLPEFHEIIQVSMGWADGHLHQFVKNGNRYHMKEDDLWGDSDYIDYEKVKVSDLLKKEKDKMIYEYDFGDDWRHDIILEKILPIDKNVTYPVCLAGKMSCPPEDCGGVWGYSDMLEVLKDPKHEEYEDLIEWLGDEFDPEYFNKEEINEMFR